MEGTLARERGSDISLSQDVGITLYGNKLLLGDSSAAYITSGLSMADGGVDAARSTRRSRRDGIMDG